MGNLTKFTVEVIQDYNECQARHEALSSIVD